VAIRNGSAEQEITLTRTDFDLLLALTRAQGDLVSRGRLLDIVWGSAREYHPNVVDGAVSRLRKSLGAHRELLVTERGRGYRLAVALSRQSPQGESK